jgi:hypothetical protein
MKKQQYPLYGDICSLLEMFLMKTVMFEMWHNINMKNKFSYRSVCCSIFLSHPLPPSHHPLVLYYTFSFFPPFPPLTQLSPPLLFFLKCMQIVVILQASLPSGCLHIFNAAYFRRWHPPMAHSIQLSYVLLFISDVDANSHTFVTVTDYTSKQLTSNTRTPPWQKGLGFVF